MRLVFFGSGNFGLPTLDRLLREHDVALVVTQPDRPAGRRRKLTPTPVGAYAADTGLPVLKPEDVNEPSIVNRIRESADVDVVIAFGQKISRAIRASRFCINLHGSLLPKYRGAAPVHRAMMAGDRETGLSVITLADRMDAGDILGQVSSPIDPMQSAGELHDHLAELGPELVLEVLARHEAGSLEPIVQDDASATRAPKLNKAEGTVRFDQSARAARCRIHGLNPWPGCRVQIGEHGLLLCRVRDIEQGPAEQVAPGSILADHTIACTSGRLELVSVRPLGGKTMTFPAYCNGRKIDPGLTMKTWEPAQPGS